MPAVRMAPVLRKVRRVTGDGGRVVISWWGAGIMHGGRAITIPGCRKLCGPPGAANARGSGQRALPPAVVEEHLELRPLEGDEFLAGFRSRRSAPARIRR